MTQSAQSQPLLVSKSNLAIHATLKKRTTQHVKSCLRLKQRLPRHGLITYMHECRQVDEDVVAHLAQHHNLLVWFVSHGVHHGVQQLDRGVKVILLAVLTTQVWHANL